MRQVSERVYVGDQADTVDFDGALLSACQSVHYKRLGWTRKTVDRGSDDYIVYDRNGWMSLNWVDGRAELYDLGGVEVWDAAFDFIDRRPEPTLIHCDRGLSRAPALALAYMAKRGLLPEIHDEADAAFREIYPEYAPGGIGDWLQAHWLELN